LKIKSVLDEWTQGYSIRHHFSAEPRSIEGEDHPGYQAFYEKILITIDPTVPNPENLTRMPAVDQAQLAVTLAEWADEFRYVATLSPFPAHYLLRAKFSSGGRRQAVSMGF
jgi:hypothetical protein